MSSFIRCVAAIAGCKGSLQNIGPGQTKMDITRGRGGGLSGYLNEIRI